MEAHEISEPGQSGGPSQALPPGPVPMAANPALPPRPIADLLVDAQFPQSALGQNVDIGGYSGIVTEIVRHSIRVRSTEGGTMSYNVNTLRKLYGPRMTPEPVEAAQAAPEAPAPVAAEPQRQVIKDPNFDVPIKPIEHFVDRPDFPQGVWGEFVDLHGFAGVVVEIVHHSHKVSLRVRSREGSSRSYNTDVLRKLYGKQGQAH